MNDTPAKKPLTRDDIEIQLACMNMADIKFAATDISLTSAIGIPFSFLMYFLNLHTDKGPLFHIFSVLLPLVPIMIVLCRNYEVFIDRICLKRGAFDVISSSIYCKDETHTQHSVHYYFYFESYPPYEVDYTTYQLASAGDPYFLVLYRTARPRIKLFYSAQLYDYQTM